MVERIGSSSEAVPGIHTLSSGLFVVIRTAPHPSQTSASPAANWRFDRDHRVSSPVSRHVAPRPPHAPGPRRPHRAVHLRLRVDADGAWNNLNNWTLLSGTIGSGFPNAVGDAASLVTAITANRTITIPTGVTITVGSILINNSHNFTVAAAGTGTLVLDNTGTGNATLLVASSLGNGSPTISAPLTLADPLQVTNQSTGVLILSGVIGESAAGRGLLVDGPGTLRLAGSTSNAYTGLTTVSAGTLELDKIGSISIATAIAGNLTINGGTATEVVNNQLADTAAVAVNAGGTFNLNGQSDTFGALTVAGGTVTTNGGRLTAGNTSFNPASTLAMHLAAPSLADRVTVNGTVAVGGTLALTVSSTIAPGTVITLIDNDGTDAVTGAFIGMPPGPVVTVGGQPFVITYSGGTGNDVTLIRLATPPTVTTRGCKMVASPTQRSDPP